MIGKLTATVGLLTAFYLGLPTSSEAQVYSENIVGYINLGIYPGDNLIADPFADGLGNTLTNLFQYNIPEGATFTKWDATQGQYLPVSTYDTTTGWSINYDLIYGEGSLFHSPTSFTNVFSGTIWPGWDPFSSSFNPPLVSTTGLQLLSCMVPIGATFYDVVGRDPLNGESVTVLNALSQLYTTTTYNNGAWDNGTPTLNVGQPAFFNLASPASSNTVPEPATIALTATGALALLAFRKRK